MRTKVADALYFFSVLAFSLFAAIAGGEQWGQPGMARFIFLGGIFGGFVVTLRIVWRSR